MPVLEFISIARGMSTNMFHMGVKYRRSCFFDSEFELVLSSGIGEVRARIPKNDFQHTAVLRLHGMKNLVHHPPPPYFIQGVSLGFFLAEGL